MFSILFRRAQATVDNAIGQAVNRAIMAVPFVVAVGFATAAATTYATRMYGAELGYLMIAAAYSVLGLIAVIALRRPVTGPSDSSASSSAEAASATEVGTESGATSSSRESTAKSALDEIDADMIASAVAAAAPLAVGPLLRNLGRNLPLVLTVIAALFLFYRANANPLSATSETGPLREDDDPLAERAA